jgi:DNA primase
VSVYSIDKRTEFLGEAMLRYQSYLDLAGPYLTGRGITRATAEHFHLGYCADPFPQHRTWEGRVLIPYVSASGTISNIKARCIQPHDCKEDGHPKYLGADGAEPELFNVSALLADDDTLYVVEGEMDCMILHQMGLNAIAYAGTNSWRSHFSKAVSPDWANLYIIADGDQPGIEAARRVAKEIHGQVVELPTGEDVSSLYVSRGEQWLRQYLGIEGDDDDIPF